MKCFTSKLSSSPDIYKNVVTQTYRRIRYFFHFLWIFIP